MRYTHADNVPRMNDEDLSGAALLRRVKNTVTKLECANELSNVRNSLLIEGWGTSRFSTTRENNRLSFFVK